MKDPLCPKCKSMYVHFNKKQKMWICEECESEFGDFESKESFMSIDASNIKYWCKDLWRCAPVPLAEAYYQLFKYVKEKNIGCTLFLIRDVFELFIKIPVSIIFNGLHELHKLNSQYFFSILDSNSKVNKLYMYSMQMLVTGKWWECVRLASGIEKDIWVNLFNNTNEPLLYQDTVCYLQKLYKMMYFRVPGKQKVNMVTWRNRVVGHSCLAYNAEENNIEIPYILEMFKLVGEVSLDYYNKIWFANNTKIPLRGIEIERIEAEVYIMYHNLLSSETSSTFMLHNFVTGEVNNFALYDGYEKGKAYLLNYGNGKRYLDTRLSEFISKHQDGVTEISSDFMLSTNDVFADSLESRDMEQFEEMLEVKDEIVGINSLYRWLINAVNSTDKGTFLLAAEQGMGKSVFCSTIDQLDDMKVQGIDEALLEEWYRFEENTAIRVWHFNSNYRGRKEIYIQGIRDAVMTLSPVIYENNRMHNANILKGKISLQWNELLNCELELRSIYFAECLNQMIIEYRERIGAEKLLLVLDGIDEVSDIEELFSYLPESKLLNEGIYLLFTSRTQPELLTKNELSSKLETYGFAEKIIFTRASISRESSSQPLEKDSITNSEYREAVEQYIINIMQEHVTESSLIITKIAETFEYRFSLVSAYSKLCKLNMMFVGAIDNNLFNVFIRKLESNAPSSYVAEVRNVLNVMIWANEPLTLRELAYLSGERYVSYRLLGVLCDLRAFVKVTRSSSGDRYSFSHLQWEEIIKTWNPQGDICFYDQCNSLFGEIEQYFVENNIADILHPSYEGELWLLKHMFDMVANYERINNKKGMREVDIEKIELLIGTLIRSHEFFDKTCNEFTYSLSAGDFWIFNLPNTYVNIVKEFQYNKTNIGEDKLLNTHKEEYFLLEEIISFYNKMLDYYSSITLGIPEEDKSEDSRTEEKKAIILYHVGDLYIKYASLVGNSRKKELFEKAKDSYQKAKELHYDIFGLWGNKLKIQYAIILQEESKHYEVCWQCAMIIDSYNSLNEKPSLEERFVLVQAYTLFAMSRRYFGNLFPFMEEGEELKYLLEGYSIIDSMIIECGSNLYIEWKMLVEQLLEKYKKTVSKLDESAENAV